MKIEGPGKTNAPDKAKKSAKSGKTESNFGDFLTDKTDTVQKTAAAAPVKSVGALLGVQAVETATERAARQRMTSRADKILDELEEVRLALIEGRLSGAHLIAVAERAAEQREKVIDPRLAALLDEIDLRAQVEIAKMEKAQS